MLIYKAVQSNIASKDKKKKWHPCLIKMGNVVDTQMIGETIAERSSLTAGDVHNVIRNLMAVMREQLLNSRTVKLEGLGTFTMVCQSRCKGVDAEADVSPAQITGLRCQFTPEYTRDAGGNITRALIQGASYIHWEREAVATPEVRVMTNRVAVVRKRPIRQRDRIGDRG